MHTEKCGRIKAYCTWGHALSERVSEAPDAKLVSICAVLILLSLLSLPLCLRASETVVLKVFVNTEDKGDYILLLTDEKDVLLRSEELNEIGFKDVPGSSKRSIGQRKYVSLQSLSPFVSFEIDERESALRITADPSLLEKSSIDLSYEGPSDVIYTQDTAAFVNYSLGYSAGDGLDFKALNIPWEAGISVGGKLGFSSFSYTKTDDNQKFVRLFSNLTADDRNTLRRVVIGDFSAFSGTLGSGGSLGGLSISKDFAIMPEFRRFPGLNLSGMLQTPSDVELYVNDLLVKKEHLPAGEFQFMNLPYATGAGDATLVITDVYGRQVIVQNPFYLTSQLLKPGLNDYSYNFGLKRKNLGQKSFEYGSPAFVGFHRHGFTPLFTGGIRAEADEDLLNVGGSATFVPLRLGETNASVAVSNTHGRYGIGGFLGYFRSGGPINGGFSVSGFSQQYANLGISSSRSSPRFGRSVSIGFNQRTFGSISVTYSATDFYREADRRRASIFYSRGLWRNASLNVSASRTKWDETTDEVFAALVIFFGGRTSGSVGFRSQDGTVSESASVQKNPPLGPGLGYRVLLDRNEDGGGDNNLDQNAAVQYRGHYGIYSAEYSRRASQDIYDFTAAGGLAFIKGAYYFSRPIADGFALVKVGDLDGVKVNYSNQEVGKTNRNGEVVVPNMISYYGNDLSIDTEDIPVNYEIEKIRKYVSPPIRGGSEVSFPVTKLQGFTGRLYVAEKGKRESAQYWGIKLRIADAVREFTVGRGGEFYFENLPKGRYPAKLFWQERKCEFELTIPQSDEMMVDLGELTCEMD